MPAPFALDSFPEPSLRANKSATSLAQRPNSVPLDSRVPNSAAGAAAAAAAAVVVVVVVVGCWKVGKEERMA